MILKHILEMPAYEGFIALFIYVISIAVIFGIILIILKSPFKYPYFELNFDVSGKRQPKIEDYIDNYLIDTGFNEIENHFNKIEDWKQKSKLKVEKSILNKYRAKQFQKVLDDENAFVFCFIRNQTRYRQQNYVKTAYTVQMNAGTFTCNYEWLLERFNELESINFETTLREYHSKNQRKLMTRELREKIMKRDNYTCQLCGKYMPDEVGLQIDHIVSIVKGGKSVESNLQVLCSKCNGSKSGK